MREAAPARDISKVYPATRAPLRDGTLNAKTTFVESFIHIGVGYIFRIIYIISDYSDVSEILISLIKQIKQNSLINLIRLIVPTLKLTRAGHFV